MTVRPPFPMLSVPHLQQQSSGDCLPACAAMVLTYLGIRVNYHRLLRLLQTRAGYGTAFSNIRALTALQVTVTYSQGQLDNILRLLQTGDPILVPVQTRELPYWTVDTAHAVVVVGIDEPMIYLNDPAFSTAPIPVPHGDFDLAWLEHDEYYAVLAT